MIFNKEPEAPSTTEEREVQEIPDRPPTYASVESSIRSPSPSPPPSPTSPPSPPSPLFNIPFRRVNFVSISKVHDSIKGSFTIDPSLFIPFALRPPLSQGETENTRKHLKLDTQHGKILAEIILVESSATQMQNRLKATMQFSSIHGDIKLKLHDHPYRPPFSLTAKSQNGHINISLPRTFHGPILISYIHGHVKISSSLQKELVTFGEVQGQVKCFVGDFSQYMHGDRFKGWRGDIMELQVIHGHVRLTFDQESGNSCSSSSIEDFGPGMSSGRSRPRFMSRFFGF